MQNQRLGAGVGSNPNEQHTLQEVKEYTMDPFEKVLKGENTYASGGNLPDPLKKFLLFGFIALAAYFILKRFL